MVVTEERGNDSMWFLCKVLVKKKGEYRIFFSPSSLSFTQPYVFHLQPRVYFQTSWVQYLCAYVDQLSSFREKFCFMTAPVPFPRSMILQCFCLAMVREHSCFCNSLPLRAHVFLLLAHLYPLSWWNVWFSILLGKSADFVAPLILILALTLCDLRYVIYPSYALIFSSLKWGLW